MSAVARALGVSRSNLTRELLVHRPRRLPSDELELVEAVKSVVGGRPTYGYRRTTAILNRQRRHAGTPTVNHKRVYRVLAAHQLLLQRYTGRQERLHEGKVVTLKSDLI